MKADIILVMKKGLVDQHYVILDPTTAEAQFDRICEELLGDEYEEITDAVDYGVRLSDVNTHFEFTGTEIIWMEQVDVNTYGRKGTLRQRFSSLREDTLNEFKTLIKGKSFDLASIAVEEYSIRDQQHIKNLVEEEDYDNLSDYDFKEHLLEVYYNDKRAEEKSAYLLDVSEANGLYLLDTYTNNTFYIGFTELNGLYTKLDVIEAIKALS